MPDNSLVAQVLYPVHSQAEACGYILQEAPLISAFEIYAGKLIVFAKSFFWWLAFQIPLNPPFSKEDF
ncbi:MAG: hypothetical protein M1438_12880 [Deltaproteobacteria bacterium]|nr:hypothetical protein [Deltaproteobacteria bacterium]